MTKRNCERCGTPFETNRNAQRFCSVACRDVGKRERQAIYSKRGEEKRREKKRMVMTKENKSLIELSAEARNAGMTYGQYVAAMKL